MAKLSKELAEFHYNKLLALHNFDYLTLAQKISIFYHDLEHEILREITGKKEYFEQFNWLKDNQIRLDRSEKIGFIPKVIIDDIDNIKNWRNEGVHENKMPEPKYKSHLYSMVYAISFFSEIQIPERFDNILNNLQDNKYSNIGKSKNIKKQTGNISKTTARQKDLNIKKINFEDLKNIKVAASPTNGEIGVRDTERPLLELFEDSNIKTIELRPFEDDGYIHYSKRKDEWWIKRKGKDDRNYREPIELYLEGKQLRNNN